MFFTWDSCLHDEMPMQALTACQDKYRQLNHSPSFFPLFELNITKLTFGDILFSGSSPFLKQNNLAIMDPAGTQDWCTHVKGALVRHENHLNDIALGIQQILLLLAHVSLSPTLEPETPPSSPTLPLSGPWTQAPDIITRLLCRQSRSLQCLLGSILPAAPTIVIPFGAISGQLCPLLVHWPILSFYTTVEWGRVSGPYFFQMILGSTT